MDEELWSPVEIVSAEEELIKAKERIAELGKMYAALREDFKKNLETIKDLEQKLEAREEHFKQILIELKKEKNKTGKQEDEIQKLEKDLSDMKAERDLYKKTSSMISEMLMNELKDKDKK